MNAYCPEKCTQERDNLGQKVQMLLKRGGNTRTAKIIKGAKLSLACGKKKYICTTTINTHVVKYFLQYLCYQPIDAYCTIQTDL